MTKYICKDVELQRLNKRMISYSIAPKGFGLIIFKSEFVYEQKYK